MPTIDQLAPATAASDTDELLTSQSGTTRKVTRAQVIAGLQPQLSLAGGTILGRSSAGNGAAEAIVVGANLSLSGGMLVAASSGFIVAQLPAGTVPSINDQIAISQAGTNVAITYAQFQSNLLAVPNINVSQALVTPTGSTDSHRLADFASSVVSVSGGTLTGPLLLAGPPTTGLHAATKGYADSIVTASLPTSGGSLSGPLLLSGDPAISIQAVTKNYVDGQISATLGKSGGSISGVLVLASDPTISLQAATKQYVDGKVARSGDTLTGPLMLAGAPTSPLQAASKSYVDIQLQTALPTTGGTLAGSLILAGDPVAPPQAATKGYVDTQVSATLPRGGGTLSGAIILSGDPVVPLQGATKQYVDTRVLRSGDTLTGQLFLAGDPSAPTQAATKAYVDSQLAGALPRSGGSLTGALVLNADPITASQAATRRYVDAQVATAVPSGGGTLAGALIWAATPVAPASLVNKQYVDNGLATTLPIAGGTLIGGLMLAANPISNLQAATKQYVDAAVNSSAVIELKSAPYAAQINGVADDTAAFTAAYQAAAAGGRIHVPSGVTVLKNPSTWAVPLTKTVKWLVDGTTLPDGTPLSSAIPTGGNPATLSLPGIVEGYSASGSEFSRSNSSTNDLAVLHSAYLVNHAGGGSSVISNARSDTIIYSSPNNYVWSGLDRLVWAGVQTPNSATAAQHVGRYVQTIRQSIGTNSNGVSLPQPQLWAACLEYRDATGKPSSWVNASLTIEMDWIGNGPDDGNSRQIQSLVVAQNDPAGTPVEISTVVGVYLAGGSSGHAYRVFNVGIPFSIAVLDTTASQQLSGAAAIRMAAGHSIAFEPTASNRLAFDSTTGTLRWNQGGLSYVVGKGLTVGWANVCSSTTTLPSYLAGNMVLLVGGSPYTVTLPSAAATPAGTGFTFSMLGSSTVTISPTGSDAIDNGPVILRASDRYHIVSDGSTSWREVFRTNSVSPRFTGPPVLPSYSVSTLPSSPGAGAKAFAPNGRKPAEGAGAGSGVEVFYDGNHWISGCTGLPVVS